jgi:DNA polymerase III subunit chi
VTELGFYQLSSRPLDAVLPKLLEKALAAGHRVLVRCRDAEQVAMLDERLWTYDDASFLPHGTQGAGHPILIGTDDAAPDGYSLLAVPGGAVPADAAAFSRVLYLFDGNDAAELAQARADWKAAKADPDIKPVYWKAGDNGRWEQAG